MKEIVQDGAEILREIAKPVPEELFDSAKLVRVIESMRNALDPELEGVALAAPQIGISYRIFIVRKDRTLPPPLPQKSTGEGLPAERKAPTPEVEVYINPEIVKTSRKRSLSDEGCLSVRRVYGTTSRHERITIRARREDGTRFERGAGGLMAQIFEHEIDHLNGILFIDHAKHLVHIQHASMRKFLYFGTPKVASDTLAALIEHGFTPAAVITSPDAPKGRGLALTPSPVKILARARGITVLTPRSLDTETIASIRAYGCDYAVVVAYGKIFPEELIAAFPLGILNVHYSLLPKYRGATPLEAALLAGDAKTGVTIQKMTKELDAGDILAERETQIAFAETARELRPRLIALGAELLVEVLPAFEKGDLTPTPQDASRATYTHKLKKEDGFLSLDTPALENWYKYRAYADTIGTYFMQNGKRIKIVSASLKNQRFVPERVVPEGKRERDLL